MAKVRREVNKAAAQALYEITNPDRAVGKVGWFESARYPTGQPVAYIAAIQEYGYPEGGIPPRLGMRSTAAAKKPAWAGVAENCARAIIAGNMDMAQAMETIGLVAAGDLRKRITEVRSPPLAVATVEARLAGKKQGKVVSISISKPLVDTGHMLATLTNVVESK